MSWPSLDHDGTWPHVSNVTNQLVGIRIGYVDVLCTIRETRKLFTIICVDDERNSDVLEDVNQSIRNLDHSLGP